MLYTYIHICTSEFFCGIKENEIQLVGLEAPTSIPHWPRSQLIKGN